MARGAMQEYFGKVRAYFAPVDRTTEQGTVFDPSVSFNLESPTTPWIALGWVENFKRTAQTSLGTVRQGATGVATTQYRTQADARVSLDFCEWGKLQMALAAGSQHMNVLQSAETQARASGGAAKASLSVLSDSTASSIVLAPAALTQFAVGDWVVVDVDYVSGATALGTGMIGYIAAAGLTADSDLVRRVSFNVSSVASISATGLQLSAPLLGGVPASGARIQKVVGFVDHEGAGFLQEWSALFALEAENGGQVFFYYPRLQAATPAEETVTELESGVRAALLHAEFVALASVDANDSENVVCYRSYLPAAGQPVY